MLMPKRLMPEKYGLVLSIRLGALQGGEGNQERQYQDRWCPCCNLYNCSPAVIKLS